MSGWEKSIVDISGLYYYYFFSLWIAYWVQYYAGQNSELFTESFWAVVTVEMGD